MIREATLADMPRLVEMSTQFIRSTAYKELFDVELLPALVLELVEKHVVFVCETVTLSAADAYLMDPPPRQEKILGMLALALVPHVLTGRRYAEEIAWWVEPGYRHGTVGPRLLHHMECYVRQNRLHMVKMLAPAGSSVGDFYRKCGYQELESAWIKVFSPNGSNDRTSDRRADSRPDRVEAEEETR